MSDKSNGFAGSLSNLFGAGPVQPGESYGAPGSGRSLSISVVTAVILIGLWWVASNYEWVKPLFLPTPESVFHRFITISQEPFSGGTLWEHTSKSLMRVFSAFFLACITAIPVGLAMGINRNRPRRLRSADRVLLPADPPRWPICRSPSSGSASTRARRSR